MSRATLTPVQQEFTTVPMGTGTPTLHSRDQPSEQLLCSRGDRNKKCCVQHEEELLMRLDFPLLLPKHKQFFMAGKIEAGLKMEHE